MPSFIDTWSDMEKLKEYAQRKFFVVKGHTLVRIENPYFIFECGNCKGITKRKTLQLMGEHCRICAIKKRKETYTINIQPRKEATAQRKLAEFNHTFIKIDEDDNYEYQCGKCGNTSIRKTLKDISCNCRKCPYRKAYKEIDA